MKKLFDILKGNREIISYLFFGVCTTAVNFIVYFICDFFGLNTIMSSAAAWIISVLFAFFTNRRYVFKSDHHSSLHIMKELFNFVLGRAFSGITDISIMLIFVDLLNYNKLIVKIISNIIVIILNYLLSKLWIFKKK